MQDKEKDGCLAQLPAQCPAHTSFTLNLGRGSDVKSACEVFSDFVFEILALLESDALGSSVAQRGAGWTQGEQGRPRRSSGRRAGLALAAEAIPRHPWVRNGVSHIVSSFSVQLRGAFQEPERSLSHQFHFPHGPRCYNFRKKCIWGHGVFTAKQ